MSLAEGADGLPLTGLPVPAGDPVLEDGFIGLPNAGKDAGVGLVAGVVTGVIAGVGLVAGIGVEPDTGVLGEIPPMLTSGAVIKSTPI